MKVVSKVSGMVKVVRHAAQVLARCAAEVETRLREETGRPAVKFTRERFMKELFAARGETLAVRGVPVSVEDYEAISEAKVIEGDLLSSFEPMVWKIAGAVKRSADTDMEVEDLYQTGCIEFIHGMYYYTRTDIKFITFMYHCVRRNLFRAVNKNARLTPACERARLLRARFEKTRRALNGPATFEEIVEAMGGLEGDDLRMLSAEMVRVANGESWSACDSEGDEFRSHYTDDEAMRRYDRHADKPEFDQVEILRTLTLNRAQQAVMDAWLKDGTPGWQTRVAETLGVSRAYVGKLKEQVEDIVREAYLDNNPAPGEIRRGGALRGIGYDVDVTLKTPVIRFGYDKKTYTMRNFRAKRLLETLREVGGKTVVSAIKAVIEMHENGTVETTVKVPSCITFRTYAKTGKPMIVMGHGKRVVSLFAPQAKRIMEAILENGDKSVILALDGFVSTACSDSKAA